MFLSLDLRFASNSLIEFSPYGANVHNTICQYPSNCFLYVFWLDLYYVEPFLTEQLFEHQFFTEWFVSSVKCLFTLQDIFLFLMQDL